MIIRRASTSSPTRSKTTVHDGLVYTVATSPTKSASLYEQAREALATIDRNLEEVGSHKSRILRATVYITDMSRKPELNKAWDEWVDMQNIPQRACIGVALEDKDLVEVLVIAAQR
jgi:enamine deaminase RidA (YjgF/YER057c/UK114 family)